MSEYHDPDAHNGKLFRAYMAVALALAVFTATSFGVNALVRSEHLSSLMGFVLILGVAIVKATLVGLYFMHLKYDWGRLYFMIVPAFILGTMLMFVLLPDIVIGWQKDAEEYPVAAAENR
jgi:cytochrome c oxidase subunit 4